MMDFLMVRELQHSGFSGTEIESIGDFLGKKFPGADKKIIVRLLADVQRIGEFLKKGFAERGRREILKLFFNASQAGVPVGAVLTQLYAVYRIYWVLQDENERADILIPAQLDLLEQVYARLSTYRRKPVLLSLQ